MVSRLRSMYFQLAILLLIIQVCARNGTAVESGRPEHPVEQPRLYLEVTEVGDENRKTGNGSDRIYTENIRASDNFRSFCSGESLNECAKIAGYVERVAGLQAGEFAVVGNTTIVRLEPTTVRQGGRVLYTGCNNLIKLWCINYISTSTGPYKTRLELTPPNANDVISGFKFDAELSLSLEPTQIAVWTSKCASTNLARYKRLVTKVGLYQFSKEQYSRAEVHHLMSASCVYAGVYNWS